MGAAAHGRGLVAEAAARDALVSAGFTVIESNFRVRGSELDVVCRDDAGLAFVEVPGKGGAVRSPFGAPPDGKAKPEGSEGGEGSVGIALR